MSANVTDNRVTEVTALVSSSGATGNSAGASGTAANSGALETNDNVNKTVSCWSQVKSFVHKHKREIALALIIAGIALMILGIGLAAGMAATGAALTVTITTQVGWKLVVGPTVLTAAGKAVVAGSAIAVTGAIFTGFGFGILLRKKSRKKLDVDDTK